jgi:hypothetical protein
MKKVSDFDKLPLALASGESFPKFPGFSQRVWLKPKSFTWPEPPALAGGN